MAMAMVRMEEQGQPRFGPESPLLLLLLFFSAEKSPIMIFIPFCNCVGGGGKRDAKRGIIIAIIKPSEEK